jgi:Transcriptional regulators
MATFDTCFGVAASGETLSSLFHKAVHCMIRAHHQHGHAEHAQMRVLAILFHEGPMPQRDLMHILHVRSTSLSELLKKLEDRGFVIRSQDPKDKRSSIVALTSQGAAKAESAAVLCHQQIDTLFVPLSEGERKQLADLLRKVVASHEAAPVE